MLVTEYLVILNKKLYTKYKQAGMPKIVLGANLETMNELESHVIKPFSN